jgi:hypothetical protein
MVHCQNIKFYQYSDILLKLKFYQYVSNQNGAIL